MNVHASFLPSVSRYGRRLRTTARTLLVPVMIALLTGSALAGADRDAPHRPPARGADTWTVPEVSQILGAWRWVETFHPWTATTDTPQSTGSTQSVELTRCNDTWLCLTWRLDGGILFTWEQDLGDLDPSTTVESFGALGQVRVEGGRLLFDGTAFDGDRHEFARESVAVDPPRSWSNLKSVYGGSEPEAP